MRVALIQTNAVIGAFDELQATIRERVAEAARQGAELAVLPELATCGYPPRDLLERRRFVQAQWNMLQQLAPQLSIPTCLGCVEALSAGPGLRLANAAAVVIGGRLHAIARKQLLPSYDVFDERRYFRPGEETLVVSIAGRRVAVTICEDLWRVGELGFAYCRDPLAGLQGQIDLLINLSASPYHHGKLDVRRRVLQEAAAAVAAPVVYVNQVGGHDELLFDGGSQAVDAHGRSLGAAARWREDLLVIDTSAAGGAPPPVPEHLPDLHAGLVMGLRDYCRKTQQKHLVLGLSGGIDSAVVAALAVEALGPAAVTGLLMPGPFSSPGSVDDARALAINLGIAQPLCSISEANEAVLKSLQPLFVGTEPGVAEENIQARLRGVLVMAAANKLGAMALTTGNKSEIAVGYCTIYGDMNGGLAPIGDLFKTDVFALAEYLNRGGERIPRASIEKPPSAELRADQKDSDSLPPYEVLDALLRGYLEEDQGPAELIARGFDAELVRRIVRLVEVTEYKRRQAAPILRVSSKAFGVGRRIPLARAIEV